MSAIILIIGGAIGLSGAFLCCTGAHAIWFSAKLLRDMATANLDGALWRAKAQQPPPMPEKP